MSLQVKECDLVLPSASFAGGDQFSPSVLSGDRKHLDVFADDGARARKAAHSSKKASKPISSSSSSLQSTVMSAINLLSRPGSRRFGLLLHRRAGVPSSCAPRIVGRSQALGDDYFKSCARPACLWSQKARNVLRDRVGLVVVEFDDPSYEELKGSWLACSNW